MSSPHLPDVRSLFAVAPTREDAFGTIVLYARILARLRKTETVLFQPSWLAAALLTGWPVSLEEVSRWADILETARDGDGRAFLYITEQEDGTRRASIKPVVDPSNVTTFDMEQSLGSAVVRAVESYAAKFVDGRDHRLTDEIYTAVLRDVYKWKAHGSLVTATGTAIPWNDDAFRVAMNTVGGKLLDRKLSSHRFLEKVLLDMDAPPRPVEKIARDVLREQRRQEVEKELAWWAVRMDDWLEENPDQKKEIEHRAKEYIAQNIPVVKIGSQTYNLLLKAWMRSFAGRLSGDTPPNGESNGLYRIDG